MKVMRSILALSLVVLLVGALGCDSDDGDDNGGTDVTTPADTSGGEDMAAPEDTGSGEEDTMTAEGACTNADDMAIIESLDPPNVTKDCLLGPCGLTNAECIKDCLINGNDTATPPIEGTGLSSDCADCYVASGMCGASDCLVACAADANSAECRECLGANCLPPFYECSGISPTPTTK